MSAAIDPLDPRYRGNVPGHRETMADFKRDSTGLYKMFQGKKYYVPAEAFDAQGNYLGMNSHGITGQGRSLIHNGMEWDAEKGRWTNKINWGNVIGLGAGGTALGFEAASLLGAGGGGGSATTTGVGEGGEFGPGTGFSGMTDASVAGAGKAAATTAGEEVTRRTVDAATKKGALDTSLKALSAIPLVKALMSNNSDSNPSGDLNSLVNQIPGLADMLKLQNTQAQRQDPLNASLTQLAMNLLPKSAFGALPGRPSVPGVPGLV